MCGITGLIAPDKQDVELHPVIARMTDVMTHRGPDDQGCVVMHGAGIGMRRLSIIDVAGGHQPIADETGDVHVVCNGEIYNFRALRAKLEAKGHRFRTRSDTEVIVHLYEDLGEDCFAELRGMFSIAIWDRRFDRLLLARDRVGKKPLFYAQSENEFLFGSEIKCLLAADPSLAEPNYHRLTRYLQHGYLFEPDTMYRRVKKLPAGHLAIYERGRLSIRRYWSLQFTSETRASDKASWHDRLDELLEDCVRVRLESEVPMGIFLSGGLDSSAVVAYAHKAGMRPLKTFTVGFDRSAWDESDDALRVARHFDTDHMVLELSETELQNNAADTLMQLVRHFDEPFGDPSALPTYHISKLARQHVTVILSGDGGDELFAGYASYFAARFARTYRRTIPFWIGRHLIPRTLSAISRPLPASLSYHVLRAARICRYSALPFDSAYRDKTCHWNHSELAELLPDEVLRESAQRDEFLPDHLMALMRSDRNLVSSLTEIDFRTFLLDDVLVKVDRMSMAHSLEVRSPLLDHRMVEFAASVPVGLKQQRCQGKAILRDVMKRYLPRQTVHKRKQGFNVPLRDWFCHGLAEMVGDYLEYGSGRLPAELFAPKKVAAVLREHRQGIADHSRKIWLLLMFAAWHDAYNLSSWKGVALPTHTSGGAMHANANLN